MTKNRDYDMNSTNLAVERALIIQKHLSRSEREWGVRELSRELGFTPASVQKIMNALNAQGFVSQNEQTKRYTLGPAILQMGLAMLGQLEVRQVARQHMEALAKATGETVLLGVQDNDQVFYIDKVLPDSEIRMDVPLGVSRPYHRTAVGKILLANLSVDEIARLTAATDFTQDTPNAISSPEQLSSELEEIHQSGFALDREEFKQGTWCVAAPIYDHNGQLVAAITVAGPTERIRDNLDDLIERVLSGSEKISTQLGYSIGVKMETA